MQQTISGNIIKFKDIFDTLYISYIKYTYKVIIQKLNYNPQVTKPYILGVGTSEAIRLLYNKFILNIYFSYLFSIIWCLFNFIINAPYSKDIILHKNYFIQKLYNSNSSYMEYKSKIKINQWLAGLIDGDGCFLLSNKGYGSLEITMDIRDERALYFIKNIYGGSIKLRSGSKSIRYRLHSKLSLINLIKDINGEIRNSTRLKQLKILCIKYNIDLIYPKNLNYDNAWLSGFFDSDGTITINKNNNQLSISISQRNKEILNPLINLYNGNIYIDRSKNRSYKWYLTKKKDILLIIEYFKNNPSRTMKNNRLHLIPKFFTLKDNINLIKNNSSSKDLLNTNNLINKIINNFFIKWNKYEK